MSYLQSTNTPRGLKLALQTNLNRTQQIQTGGVTIADDGLATTVATMTGAGTIKSMWFTTAQPQLGWYARLQIFVDGELTPRFDCELATLFMTTNSRTDLTGEASTENWWGVFRFGGQQVGCLFFPASFSNGCVVKVYNPGGGLIPEGSGFFFQTAWTPDVTSKLRLTSAQINSQNIATVAWNATYDFLNLGAGNSGWLVFHDLWGEGFGSTINDNSWQERNYRIFIDGEGTASFESSGVEDFFLNGYYFGSAVFGGHTPPKSLPWAAYVYRSTVTRDFDGFASIYARDMLNDFGGIRFNNGVIMRLNNDGVVTNNGMNLRHTTLYYTGI